jgi:hypothetical protein
VKGAVNVKRLPPARPDERRLVLLELFNTDRHNPLFESVDPAHLRAALERLEQNRRQDQTRVMGAMAGLIWLGRMERRRRVDHH